MVFALQKIQAKLWPMAYEIEFIEDALRDYRSLEAHVRATIRDALDTWLRHEPTKLSKSRIKRLRELRRPQYHLRVGDIRVYYDVEDLTVTIMGIVAKTLSEDWLAANSVKEND